MEANKTISSMVLAIIILVLVFVFVAPMHQKTLELQAQVRQKNAEYNGMSLYYEKVSESFLEIQSRREAIEKMESALPPDFSISPIIYFFQKKSEENQVELKSVLFSNPMPTFALRQQNNGIKNIFLTIELSGEYLNLRNLVNQIESSSRLFNINSISLAPQDPLNLQAPINYNLKLEILTNSY